MKEVAKVALTLGNSANIIMTHYREILLENLIIERNNEK
jgi:hypothetical protein